MSAEAIIAYVNTERARGIPDAMIRAELEKNGWKESDIAQVLPRVAASLQEVVTGPRTLANWFVGLPEQVAHRTLVIGVMLFLVSSAILLLAGAGRNADNKLVFAAFSVTHIVNAVAAFFLFLSVWRLSRSTGFRVWVGLLGTVVGLFALTSFLHFLSIATDATFFHDFQQVLLGDDYLPLFIYFVLLPLQAVVFLLLAITLWVLRYLRGRRGETIVLRPYLVTTGLFLLMALLALGDLYLVMDGVSFF